MFCCQLFPDNWRLKPALEHDRLEALAKKKDQGRPLGYSLTRAKPQLVLNKSNTLNHATMYFQNQSLSKTLGMVPYKRKRCVCPRREKKRQKVILD